MLSKAFACMDNRTIFSLTMNLAVHVAWIRSSKVLATLASPLSAECFQFPYMNRGTAVASGTNNPLTSGLRTSCDFVAIELATRLQINALIGWLPSYLMRDHVISFSCPGLAFYCSISSACIISY